jgi:tripartite-type tricarboxylate transporter receptor subunit TctC
MRINTVMIATIIAATSVSMPATAQGVADFYRDKTVTLLVGHEPGTGFDIYARALMPFFGKHIPGNPKVIVQNMPGASGVSGTNWLYNIAPKDGTVLGTFSQNVIVERLFGNTAARYEAARFQWIGNMEQSAAACAFATSAGIKSFDDVFTREVRLGAVGATGPIGQSGRALNRLFGTKLNIVYGYKGSASVKLAIQNGEVQGICGLPVSTLTSFWKDVIDSGQMKIMLQLSAKPLPGFGDVIHIDKYIKNEEQRQIVDLVFGTQTLGRTFAAPAETPPDRVAALRAAFMATMQDAEFRAHAKKANIDLSPMTGEEVEKMVKGYYAASPQIVEKAIATIKPE